MITPKLSSDELLPHYIEEVVARMHDGEHVDLEMPLDVALSLCSALQFLLRGSLPAGPVRDQVEEIAHVIQARVSSTPAIAEAMRRGWRPEYDSPPRDGLFWRAIRWLVWRLRLKWKARA